MKKKLPIPEPLTPEIFCDQLDFRVDADIDAALQTHVIPFSDWMQVFRTAHANVATADRNYDFVYEQIRSEFLADGVKYTADAMKSMLQGHHCVQGAQEAIDVAKTNLECLRLARELHKERLEILKSLHYSQRATT
jgi:hypothetical protein